MYGFNVQSVFLSYECHTCFDQTRFWFHKKIESNMTWYLFIYVRGLTNSLVVKREAPWHCWNLIGPSGTQKRTGTRCCSETLIMTVTFRVTDYSLQPPETAVINVKGNFSFPSHCDNSLIITMCCWTFTLRQNGECHLGSFPNGTLFTTGLLIRAKNEKWGQKWETWHHLHYYKYPEETRES